MDVSGRQTSSRIQRMISYFSFSIHYSLSNCKNGQESLSIYPKDDSEEYHWPSSCRRMVEILRYGVWEIWIKWTDIQNDKKVSFDISFFFFYFVSYGLGS